MTQSSQLAGSGSSSRRCVPRREPDVALLFSFEARSGDRLDQDGNELANLEDAAKEAGNRAQEIASKDALNGAAANSRVITIADEQWRPVMELPF